MNHHHHHQSVDGLVNLLTKANHDLTAVHFKLQQEFQKLYPDNANPMKLVGRIKKVQEEVVVLKEQCRELLIAKQDLVDKARTTLVGNRNSLRRMEVAVGIPVPGDEEDPAFENFNKVIDEWTSQARSRTGDKEQDPELRDVNQLLFSAIVETN